MATFCALMRNDAENQFFDSRNCYHRRGAGHFFPMPGGYRHSDVFAGMALAPSPRNPASSAPAAKFLKRRSCGQSFFLGLGLDIHTIGASGKTPGYSHVTRVCFGLIVTGIYARLVGLRGPVALLHAVGTSICGGSAIAAVAGISRAGMTEKRRRRFDDIHVQHRRRGRFPARREGARRARAVTFGNGPGRRSATRPRCSPRLSPTERSPELSECR